MKTITIQIPDHVDLDDREALMSMAMKLFERGKLTLGQAAEMVGLTKRAFMDVMGNYEVSLFGYTPSELNQDIENAKSHHI
jgi:predicted HTH domain antitoxin